MVADLVKRFHNRGGESAKESGFAAEALGAVFDNLKSVRGLRVRLHRPRPPGSENLETGDRLTIAFQVPRTPKQLPCVGPRVFVRAVCCRKQFPGATRVGSPLPFHPASKQVKRINFSRTVLARGFRAKWDHLRNGVMGAESLVAEPRLPLRPQRNLRQSFPANRPQNRGCVQRNLNGHTRLHGLKPSGYKHRFHSTAAPYFRFCEGGWADLDSEANL